jgi:Holliday junction DNA helicase RuvB
MIIANEMSWGMLDLIGSTAGNPQGLSQKILGMKPQTMFFIDEIHALRKPVQEVLYPVLEDNRLLYRMGSAQGEFALPPLTVIGATTDLGKLAQPFIDRFQLDFALQFYEPDELEVIGQITAGKLGLELPDGALELVAGRSRGTPRIMNTNLKWLRDFKIYRHAVLTDTAFVEEVLWTKLKIDPEGLRPLDRNYLRALSGSDRPVGIEALASRLRQAKVTLENTVEPYLMYTGMAERAGNGRVITDKGRAHLAWLKDRRRRN